MPIAIKSPGGESILGSTPYLDENKLKYMPVAGFTTIGGPALGIKSLGIITDKISDGGFLRPGCTVDIYLGDSPATSKLAASLKSYQPNGVLSAHFPLSEGADCVIASVPEQMWVDPQGRTKQEMAENNKYFGVGSIIEDFSRLTGVIFRRR